MTRHPLPALAGTAAALVLAAASMLTGASTAPSDEPDHHRRNTGTAVTDASKAGVYVNGALSSGTAP
ncbi:hypothetical protein ABZ565_17275 [Streptomyces sp. NPDC016469]|uniref:hypothetical protein n=1 Tax=Streptomyces sp. NPDC016469 TaxID=3157191 RepID=UPI00340036BE